MTATTAAPPRIATLDIVRGVAVMGILAMNIVAFSMPFSAYMNPLAYGTDAAIDYVAWAFNFVFIDGKMRGLFSFLFGASMLLVIQRAEAGGRSAASVTFRRQLWLLGFGMIHFYLIWFGDILIGYAIIGMIAWFFRRKSVKALVRIGIVLVAIQLLIMGGMAAGAHYLSAAAAQPGAPAEILAEWSALQGKFGVPSATVLQSDLALHLGSWTDLVQQKLTEKFFDPYFFLVMFGWETLAYMLFGMAALKSGFLTGSWDNRRYWRAALIGFAISLPAYILFAVLLLDDGFTVPGLMTWSMAAPVLARPLMVVGYAALIILATRNGGWLVARIAAAGRTAFTNYLGTSIVLTAVFYGWGLGLYGSFGRAELWVVVIAMWALMLAWSKPWLDRFAYGPLEWAWRSLARWDVQPIRKTKFVPAA